MQKTGFQMLNNDEIVTSVQEEFDPVDDETDEDEDNNNESSKSPSNTDAFSALETAMECDEQQSECCPTQLLLLKIIRELIQQKKRRCTMLHGIFAVPRPTDISIKIPRGTQPSKEERRQLGMICRQRCQVMKNDGFIGPLRFSLLMNSVADKLRVL
ncbi:uncharacterized protein TNCV_1401181 [Trichonephila clavipes]|nr:uncharacterized protein TNCV_1401181 [Trichonephila clavipes]